MPTAWSPSQYERFRSERLEPVHDLVALVEPGVRRALDLGCGTGEPTELLLAHLGGAADIEGLDSSPEMLARAAPRASARMRFRQGDIASLESFAGFDLVFSNAALHWVPDHRALFRRLLGTLAPGAQLALQMPNNQHHPAHVAASEVARQEPFAGWLGGFVQRSAVEPLERYAAWLWEARVARVRLFERVYCHTLDRAADVAEWLKGSLLLPYLERLDAEQARAFLDAHAARLRDVIGEDAPYLYTFRRMFVWARTAG
ncbi:MAG: methyltransferase domain-containing protein, partial [Polyangiaceae bacterium]|nr:methyltransferase domain-containing protein [Polyangiaceae bacterium]